MWGCSTPIGWVGRSETRHPRAALLWCGDDQLPARLRSGRQFFFTVNLAERRQRLLTTHIDLLRRAFRKVRRGHPFQSKQLSFFPTICTRFWTLPQDDADFAQRWRLINQPFRTASPQARVFRRTARVRASAEFRSAAIGSIRCATKQISRVTWITFISIRWKHRHVRRVKDWPYSSFHRMVKLGLYRSTEPESRRQLRKLSANYNHNP